MEAVLHANFVPNDLQLSAGEHRFILLTGPNMGGKSTYLRQAGLLAIMAQIGSFVPAKAMRLGTIDRIFTRIGAGDDLASGQSTFYMEMAEAANILRRSTRALVAAHRRGGARNRNARRAGDRTGDLRVSARPRGAGAAGALCDALSRAVLRWPNTGELVANYHITAVENTARGGAPVFSHRVQPGSSSRSFGIEVARMAGLPDAVVERAQEIADALSGEADIETRVPLRRRRCPKDRRRSGSSRSCGETLSIRLGFCTAVAVIAAAFADPLVEFVSNAGWFGPGTFTDRSNLDVLPALVAGVAMLVLYCVRRANALVAGRALPRNATVLIPAVLALQLVALFAMESAEQLAVFGHLLGPTVWLGGPIGFSLAVHAFSCAALTLWFARSAPRLAVTALRVIRVVRALATLRAEGNEPLSRRRRDEPRIVPFVPVFCRIGERGPPLLQG